jgi:hypothetical protein
MTSFGDIAPRISESFVLLVAKARVLRSSQWSPPHGRSSFTNNQKTTEIVAQDGLTKAWKIHGGVS